MRPILSFALGFLLSACATERAEQSKPHLAPGLPNCLNWGDCVDRQANDHELNRKIAADEAKARSEVVEANTEHIARAEQHNGEAARYDRLADACTSIRRRYEEVNAKRRELRQKELDEFMAKIPSDQRNLCSSTLKVSRVPIDKNTVVETHIPSSGFVTTCGARFVPKELPEEAEANRYDTFLRDCCHPDTGKLRSGYNCERPAEERLATLPPPGAPSPPLPPPLPRRRYVTVDAGAP